jgi:hypothetical protein
MRKFIILIFVCSVILKVTGQTSTKMDEPLLFDEFTMGKVIMKSGDTKEVMLNYNPYAEKMLFTENNRLWEISEPELVESVIINERIFVPYKKVFYEMIPCKKYSLYIKYSINELPEAKQAGYGSTSETTAITSYSNIISSSGTNYNLNKKEGFKTVMITLFWIKKGNKYYKANNIKQFRKYFPEKADAIEAFVKDKKINFDDPEDMITLIRFCNE